MLLVMRREPNASMAPICAKAAASSALVQRKNEGQNLPPCASSRSRRRGTAGGRARCDEPSSSVMAVAAVTGPRVGLVMAGTAVTGPILGR